MHKYSSILLASVMSTVIPYSSMASDMIDEWAEFNQTPKTIGESIIGGALIGLKNGLMASDSRNAEAIEQQYMAQQMAYEEMLLRQEEERQRQIALYNYIHSKHRKPTASEKKQADKITEDLNKN